MQKYSELVFLKRVTLEFEFGAVVSPGLVFICNWGWWLCLSPTVLCREAAQGWMAKCRHQTKSKQHTALFTTCSDGDEEQLLNHKKHIIQKTSEKGKAEKSAKIGLNHLCQNYIQSPRYTLAVAHMLLWLCKEHCSSLKWKLSIFLNVYYRFIIIINIIINQYYYIDNIIINILFHRIVVWLLKHLQKCSFATILVTEVTSHLKLFILKI